MKIITLFNNKGGVGKTTLTYHLANILAEPETSGGFGKKVLLMDLDPQCNLTIHAIKSEEVDKIWEAEEAFIDKFEEAQHKISAEAYEKLLKEPRSIHFLLKPTEEGISDIPKVNLPPPFMLKENLGILPGRLTLHQYEQEVAQRWNAAFVNNPLSIRTITKIRALAQDYSEKNGYDYVIIDTAPSLGILNKIIISMADGFLIPCFPDVFSTYGIKNIGKSLTVWAEDFTTLKFMLKGKTSLQSLPEKFVQFLGYTITNAKKYATKNPLGISNGHYKYAKKFPKVINDCIKVSSTVSTEEQGKIIGEKSIIYGYNTFPSMAQRFNMPIWEIPEFAEKQISSEILDSEDRSTIAPNIEKYKKVKDDYYNFAKDLIKRVNSLA